MKIYVANNHGRKMIEIALGFGVINSLTVADAIELRNKLDARIRAVEHSVKLTDGSGTSASPNDEQPTRDHNAKA